MSRFSWAGGLVAMTPLSQGGGREFKEAFPECRLGPAGNPTKKKVSVLPKTCKPSVCQEVWMSLANSTKIYNVGL